LPGLKEAENFKKLVMAMKQAEASKSEAGSTGSYLSNPTSNLIV